MSQGASKAGQRAFGNHSRDVRESLGIAVIVKESSRRGVTKGDERGEISPLLSTGGPFPTQKVSAAACLFCSMFTLVNPMAFD